MIEQTPHQQRIEQFMRLAKQQVPSRPTIPDEATRLLRARLIFEECMETIEALGVKIEIVGSNVANHYLSGMELAFDRCEFLATGEFNMVEAIDGCIDVSVVTVGTLSSMGLKDQQFLEIVDANNLEKFGTGHSWSKEGKLIKPADHKSPTDKIQAEIDMQSASCAGNPAVGFHQL